MLQKYFSAICHIFGIGTVQDLTKSPDPALRLLLSERPVRRSVFILRVPSSGSSRGLLLANYHACR